MTAYVVPSTHDNRIASNLPDAIRTTKKSMVNTVGVMQIFPLGENTLHHAVQSDGCHPHSMTPSVLAMLKNDLRKVMDMKTLTACWPTHQDDDNTPEMLSDAVG